VRTGEPKERLVHPERRIDGESGNGAGWAWLVPGEHSDTQSPTIILVEDDTIIRLSVADALRSAGYTVIEAASGMEAIRILAVASAIDALVTDVSVPPGPDGVELASRFRAKKRNLPVVFATASNRPTNPKACDAWVQKPYDPNEVVLQVNRFLGGNSRRR
jgi:CheY-like chemotaxis protein